MKKIAESKIATLSIVIITVILAGIAIFTAVRLYQLRQEPIAPTAPSKPLAFFECTEYDLLVDVDGTVRIHNVSGGDRPTQNIDLLIDGVSIGNFDIPALNEDEVEILGDLNLAPGDYNWSINGVPGCTQPTEPELKSCQEITFNISGEDGPTATPTSAPTSTPIPTATSTPIATATPTSPPIGGGPTNTPIPTATPTTTQTSSTSPTPTSGQIAQASPATTISADQLPDAGIGYPTIILSLFAIFIIFLAITLAI